MRITLIAVCLMSVVGGCSYLNRQMGLEDDHFIEEFLESKFHKATGFDIDFSPSTPE